MKKYVLITVLTLTLSVLTAMSAQAYDFRSQSVGPHREAQARHKPDGFWRAIRAADSRQRHIIHDLAQKDPTAARKALKRYLHRRNSAIRNHGG